MADYYTNLAFGFTCTEAEAELLQIALVVEGDEEPYPDELKPFFPTIVDFAREVYDQGEDDLWFSAGVEDSDYTDGEFIIAGTNANPWAIAQMIRHLLKPELPITFEWSGDCSKLRIGAFGGGCAVVYNDRIILKSTGDMIEEILRG